MYQKPIPLKTQDNQPYWDAADRHELMLQKCQTCHAYNHPPNAGLCKMRGHRTELGKSRLSYYRNYLFLCGVL
ncbi:hypothetical protein LSPH24S_01463 [Lysinibacillus sphaericus]